jgi:hypothetical protein
VREMAEADYAEAQRDTLVRQAGYTTYHFNE